MSQATNSKLKEVRKRLLNDFDFYSKHSLKIRTKSGDIQPLKLNAAQTILNDAVSRQVATEGKVRVIILKARQQVATFTSRCPNAQPLKLWSSHTTLTVPVPSLI